MKTPPGAPGASMNQDFFIEFEFIEFGCDHQLLNELEAKDYAKNDVFLLPLRIFFQFLCFFASKSFLSGWSQ